MQGYEAITTEYKWHIFVLNKNLSYKSKTMLLDECYVKHALNTSSPSLWTASITAGVIIHLCEEIWPLTGPHHYDTLTLIYVNICITGANFRATVVTDT